MNEEWKPVFQARHFRRAVEAVLFAGFLACVVWQGWIHFSYDARMPSSPQPNTERVYRIVDHRAVRYVTRADSSELILP
jgi:hypothetical protein